MQLALPMTRARVQQTNRFNYQQRHMNEHQSTIIASHSNHLLSPHRGRLVTVIARLSVEAGFWLLPACLFLIVSGLVFDRGWSAVAPHLWMVLRLALGLAALRLILTRRFELVTISLYTLAFAALIAFYLLTLVGYSFWGRTPTIPILIPYIRHFSELLATLQVAWYEVILAAAVFLFVASAIGILLIRQTRPWVSILTNSVSPPMRLIIAVTSLIISGFALVDVSVTNYARHGEPFTLMFNPHAIAVRSANSQRSRVLQNNLALADRETYVASAARPARNVIMIIGDALRPSRMSVFGASRATTPELEKLAATDSLAYKGVITTSCAESFCGLISISRSRYAHSISRQDLSLSEVLALHGYQQRLILGGDHTNFYGLRGWFGKVDHYWDGTLADTYANDDRAVLHQLESLSRWNGTPEYLQLHFMSTHAMGTRVEDQQMWTPSYNYYRSPAYKIGNAEHTSKVINHYDNGLLQFDKNVAQALNILRKRGYLEDALVVISGDHGEMLGEHQRFSHGNGVYQPVIEVPLLVLRFGHSGQHYDPQPAAAQIDIAPSILTELELPIPARWQGSSLNEIIHRQFVFFEHDNEFGLIDFSEPAVRWKYWIDRKSGQEYAFELLADPGETTNRVASISLSKRELWRQKLEPSLASEPLR